ncbi:MAG: AAA family ATPase [Candidatus Nanopelagicales bacterium]
MLVGREDERDRLRDVLDRAASGRAGALLLIGEPGIGKTSLLDAAEADAEASGFTVVRTTALQAESGINGSGLSSLTMALTGRVAGDVDVGPWPLLQALAGVAESGPLAVFVDDVHWLDDVSLTSLGFAVRRLLADPVAVVMAARPEIDRRPELVDVPRLWVGPLADDDAVAVLALASPSTPPDVALGIAHALGNVPLALVEAPDLLAADVLAGRVPLDLPIPVGPSVRERYARGVADLEPDVRRALVLAAADDSDDPTVLVAALGRRGLGLDTLLPAEAAGLVVLGPGVAFRHPLVRSAVHADATADERREAHRVLAEEYHDRGDLSRYARHASDATVGADPVLAEALEREAGILAGSSSGALAASVAERAATLSATPADRWRRLTLAAELYPATEAGARRAWQVIEGADDADLVARAVLALSDQDIYSERAAVLLDDVLDRPLSPDVEQRALASRIWSALQEDDLPTLRRLADRTFDRAADGAPGAGPSWRLCFAIGSAYTSRGEHREAATWLRRARDLSDPLGAEGVPVGDLFDWATVTGWLGEDPMAHRARISAACRRWRRIADPLSVIAAEVLSSEMARRDGLWERAVAHAEAGLSLGPIAGTLYGSAGHRLAAVTAARGERERTDRAIRETERVFELSGMRSERHWVDYTYGLLGLTLGDLDAAMTRLERLRGARLLGRGARDAVANGLALLVEAYAGAGRPSDAREVARELGDWLDGIVDRYGLALVHRVHAVAGGDDPEVHFRAALAEHDRSDEPFEAARTRLLYGEWLRRSRQPSAAREHLRAALEAFDAVRAGPWAERARRELAAAGESPRGTVPPPGPAGEELTAQELRVAMAVADGMSNAEVAAALFLSVKTVEFHLTRVYRKLGVRSRGGVARALSGSGAVA